MIKLLKQAKSRGCDLVVFPEMALTTFFPRYYEEDIAKMDRFWELMTTVGSVGEMPADAEMLPHKPSTYFQRNCWMGSSFPGPDEAKAIRALGVDKVMWGSDYPHSEGTYPYTREALRYVFHDWEPNELQAVLVKYGKACAPGAVAAASARAPAQTPSVPLDEATLRELVDMVGPEPLRSIIRRHIEEFESEWSKLETALEAGDQASARRQAHGLKSAFGSLGALQARDLAKSIEAAARDDDQDRANALLEELRESAEAAHDALEAVDVAAIARG